MLIGVLFCTVWMTYCDNCAIRVRAHLKNIDEVIATIKAATIKNKNCKKDFHYAGLPSPPYPVITRCAT